MYLGQKDEKVHQFVLIKIKASIIKTYNLFLDIFQRLEIRCFTYLHLNGFE